MHSVASKQQYRRYKIIYMYSTMDSRLQWNRYKATATLSMFLFEFTHYFLLLSKCPLHVDFDLHREGSVKFKLEIWLQIVQTRAASYTIARSWRRFELANLESGSYLNKTNYIRLDFNGQEISAWGNVQNHQEFEILNHTRTEIQTILRILLSSWKYVQVSKFHSLVISPFL